jgi:hypothetical protein
MLTFKSLSSCLSFLLPFSFVETLIEDLTKPQKQAPLPQSPMPPDVYIKLANNIAPNISLGQKECWK